MGEETNLDMMEEDLFEDAFEDDDGNNPEEPEGSVPTEAERTSGETEGPEGEKPAQPEQKYTVKYNGQTQELTLAELITHAQKGMNYDHVVAERDQLKNAPELVALDRYAKSHGMTRTQYVAQLEAADERRTVEELTANGMDEAQAKELVRLRRQASEQQEAEQKRTEAKQAENQRLAALRAFTAKYPAVKKFPPEVVEAINGGATPLEAYQEYELVKLKAEIAAAKQNETNRQREVGSVADGAAKQKKDSFLEGWDSV